MTRSAFASVIVLLVIVACSPAASESAPAAAPATAASSDAGGGDARDGGTGVIADASGDADRDADAAPWSCTGSYGTAKAADGDYYLTAFGCWVDAAGGSHGDPGDNCIPSCLAQAKSAGLCLAADTGKQCEERVTWFTADAARFGCLTRVRVTDPKSGKSVVAVALDFGPACSVEASVSKAVLDASGRVDRALFGADQGASDRALVHVVEVDPSTPLGP